MRKLVDDIVQAVRRISTQLRLGVLDLGLLAAIESQAFLGALLRGKIFGT